MGDQGKWILHLLLKKRKEKKTELAGTLERRPRVRGLGSGEQDVLPEKGLPAPTVSLAWQDLLVCTALLRAPCKDQEPRECDPAPGKPLSLTGQEVDEGNLESTHCSK